MFGSAFIGPAFIGSASSGPDRIAFIMCATSGRTLQSKLRIKAHNWRHMILVDTSASQTGKFRTDSAAILKSVIEQLPAGHTVHVVAVDSTVEPLTNGFVASGSGRLSV